jgi:carboxyl-terminal processing protease
MVLGFNLRDTLRNKRDLVTVIQRNDHLEEIIDLINQKYVDSVSSNQMYTDAIGGVLRSLDPHTVYIPSDDVQTVNDDLDGEFSGIGVEFSIVRDTVAVTSVIDKGPAYHAGIQIGDQFIKVGDSVIAGVHISSERIIHLLRGKQKSNVSVTIQKQPRNDQERISITRDMIPVYSIDAALMLDSITAFIKINRFSATTYQEFRAALQKLQSKGAKRLIIDLRDNPGGFLDAASSIADDLLDDNKLIVYTKGLHSPKMEYKASEKGLFEQGRLAILVDENSASASEILSGAMQDQDRGVVIGRRTFGKGLVQEQYDLPDGAALRLTVARYYTPSGRCIQRSFAKGRDAYSEAHEKRFEDEEQAGHDTFAQEDTTVYYTARHRKVYGGGGIKPDIYVPLDSAHLSSAYLSIAYSPVLKTALWDHYIHTVAQKRYGSISEFDKGFDGAQQIIDTYLAGLSAKERSEAVQELARPGINAWLQLQIKAQIARYLFHDAGYYTITLHDDDVARKALETLNSADYSHILGDRP